MVLHANTPLGPAAGAAAPTDAWFASLRADWAATLAAGMVPLVVGDLNARVAAQPDWPGWQECSPPRSTYPSNCPRGGMLLDLRKDMGARLANGRVCGDTEGATTSVGASGAGRAVVATWTM